jgi:hypothetical protein
MIGRNERERGWNSALSSKHICSSYSANICLLLFHKEITFTKKRAILHVDITKNISLIQKWLGNKPYSLCIFIISCSFYLLLKFFVISTCNMALFLVKVISLWKSQISGKYFSYFF